MKKSSILAAMALVAMAGCSNNEFEDGPVTAAAETPIIVNTGVATKAAIATGDNVTATFALISSATAATPADWGKFEPRLTNDLTDGAFTAYATQAANVSVGSFVANDTKAQTISFQPTLYYNKTEADEGAYMVGVAPAGTAKSSGVVEFTTVDGEQDVMYAAQINKGKVAEAATNTATFAFEHKTGQVSFKVKKDKTTLENAVVTVKSIKLKTVALPKSIKLADGSVTYAKEADLLLPNVITSQAVTETGVTTGNPVMIAPRATMSIDAVITITEGGKSSDKTYSNVPVTFTGSNGGAGVTEGYSSLVTINVKKTTSTETAITATATVAKWKTGNTGEVELD